MMVCIKWLQKPHCLKVLYEWTPDFAPFQNQYVFLDLKPVASLYDAKTLKQSLQTHLKTPFLWFEGCSLLSVWAQSNGQSAHVESLSIEHLDWLIDPFQNLSKEERVLLKTMQSHLHWLGIQSIQDYRSIPIGERVSRFGKIARLIEDRLTYPQALGWPRFQYVEPLYLEKYKEEGVYTFEALWSFISEVLDYLWKRIGVRSVQHMQVSCGWFKKVWQHFSFEFCIPQPDPRSCLAIIRPEIERVWQGTEIYEPLTCVRIEIPHLVEAVPMEDQLRVVWSMMKVRFGDEVCFQAKLLESYVPEFSWERCHPSANKGSDPVSRQRPLALFRVPKKLKRKGKNISLLEAPFFTWSIIHWEGPEPIDTRWWLERIQRYYYKVWTHLGVTLWVYKTSNQDLFLHGFFD
jgi:hypothetical protein